jgi:hypothetical protein
MAQWFSGGNKFNDLAKFLHFYEEDLALYLNNLEFPLPMSDLYQVWLKLACWFWRRFFFNTNTNEYGFPYCGPSRPWGPWFEETWIYIISESFHVNMIYSGSVVLEKKIFKWTHPIYVYFFDYLPFEEDLALYSNNLESPLPKDNLYQV